MKGFFKEYIKGHRVSVTIILVMLALVGFVVPQLILQLPWTIQNQTSGIELIALCSQIVSAFFVILGTVIAVWQYYLSSNQGIYDSKFAKVNKAIELSGYYKDDILHKYSFVRSVFEIAGIMKVIESKRKYNEIKHFDIDELKEIYTPEEIEKFEKLISDENYAKAIIRVSKMYNFELRDYCGCNEDGKIVFKNISDQKEIVAEFYKKYIVGMLNNAEYFAMFFTHNVADESVIFQSIYPTYLEMCFIMYYYIARNSDPSSAKLYTNIAKLYGIWRRKANEQSKKIINQTRDASNDFGTIVK